MPDRQLSVFAWLTGQDYNIGDSLLRRPYLRELSKLGPVTVWVRDASEGFLAGLGTEVAAGTERSFRQWFRKALVSVVKRPTLIALNAGEIRRTRGGAVRIPAMALLGLLARVRGGGSVWLGSSIARGKAPKLISAMYKLSARSISYVRWREAGSLTVRRSADVGPDWAFAEGTLTQDWRLNGRTKAAFVLRGDRGRPSDSWVDWARSSLAATGLEPVFVVQVHGDEELARDLAEELGGTVLEWPTAASHAVQEEAVRKVYAESAIVIGDRLHGLIVGATEGAVPIGWVESSTWKIGAHFEAAGMTYVGAFEGSAFSKADTLTSARIEDLRTELPHRIDAARGVLESTSRSVWRAMRRR